MTLTNAVMERELRRMLHKFDAQNETMRSVRERLVERLGLASFPADKKAAFKQIMTRLIKEQEEEEENNKNDDDDDDIDDEENDDNDEQDSEDDDNDNDDKSSLAESNDNEDDEQPKKATKKRKSRPAKKPTKKKKAAAAAASTAYSKAVNSLLELGKAIRVGPSLYRGLKQLDDEDEQIDVLTERLQAAGASWKGRLPGPRDIAQAKAAKQRQDDLDGIDTSLILDEGRGGRRRARVSYVQKEQPLDGDEEEEEEEEEEAEFDGDDDDKQDKQSDNASDEEEEEEAPPVANKRAKKKAPAINSSDEEEDDEDFDGDDDDEDEEE